MARPSAPSSQMAQGTPCIAQLNAQASPAPTELDSCSSELEEERQIEEVILPTVSDSVIPNAAASSTPILLVEDPNAAASSTPTLLVEDEDKVEDRGQSMMPTLPLQAGIANHLASSSPGIETLIDDRMNGSVMPIMTETQEVNLQRALQPSRRVWSVSDVLAMQPQPVPMCVHSPALLPSGNGTLSVASAMRSILAPPNRTFSEHIECRLPNAYDGHFNHCCRIINDIDVVFYIGITEDPNGRWEQHNADQTVGPMPNMIILVEAESSRMTATLEMQLLARYLPYMRCANRSSGGERASAGSPHYLYVLRASSPLLRRGH